LIVIVEDGQSIAVLKSQRERVWRVDEIAFNGRVEEVVDAVYIAVGVVPRAMNSYAGGVIHHPRTLDWKAVSVFEVKLNFELAKSDLKASLADETLEQQVRRDFIHRGINPFDRSTNSTYECEWARKSDDFPRTSKTWIIIAGLSLLPLNPQ